MVRVGIRLAFAQAPEAIACVTGVELSADTARRLTEAAGTHLLALDDAELQAVRATLPEPAAGPAVQPHRAASLAKKAAAFRRISRSSRSTRFSRRSCASSSRSALVRPSCR